MSISELKYGVTDFAVYLLMALFLGGCAQGGLNIKAADGSFNLEETVDVSREKLFSALYSSVETIPLETNDSCLLSGRAYVLYADDHDIFVSSSHEIFHFTSDGTFLNTVGRKGNGPGEYAMLYAASVDGSRKRLVYHVGQGRIQYWGYDGKWQGGCSLANGEELSNVMYAGGRFVAERREYSDQGLRISLCVYDETGKLLNSSPISWDRETVDITMHTFPLMYVYDERVRYKDMYGDVLYGMDDSGTMQEVCRFDMGCYKPAREYLEDMNKREALLRDFVQLVDIRESSDEFYLMWVHRKQVYGLVLEKSGGEILFCGEVENPQKTGGGIPNDVLGGGFWPSYIGGNGELYALLPVEKMSSEGREFVSMQAHSRFPLTDESNPVVLRVKR